ncbi:MAG: hypothetical protein HFJ50_02100 [Clostridia bacterium]|jgi:hypothetical protein|nr:hypothetical protein [Clostridia bacterium]
MNEKLKELIKKHQNLLLIILVAFIGMLVFVFVYGFDVLNVTNDEWLYNAEDLKQHYYGWVFFRNADWTFPIGLFDTLSYPNYASIIFTDSVPLFAIFFKVISGILPETFQYFGIFGLLCYILQGIFAFILLRKYIDNKIVQVIRSSIFHYFSLYVTKNVYTYSTFSKFLSTNWTMFIRI